MKKSFLLKFLLAGITAMILSTNANALKQENILIFKDACINTTGFINGLLYEDRIADSLTSNDSFTLFAAIDMNEKSCDKAFSRVGLSVNTSINKRGSSYNYQPKDVCINFSKYIKHIRSKDNKFKLKYFAFTNRLSNEYMLLGGVNDIHNFKKSKKIRQKHIGYDLLPSLVNLKNSNTYNVEKIIHKSFELGYQGTEKDIGFNDKNWLNFMRFVSSKDFYSADDIIEKSINYDFIKIGFDLNCQKKGFS